MGNTIFARVKVDDKSLEIHFILSFEPINIHTLNLRKANVIYCPLNVVLQRNSV